MLVVLDPNVIVSAVLSPAGPPAELVRRWLAGEYELLVSPSLIDELTRVLSYPKITKRVDAGSAMAVIELLRTESQYQVDPVEIPEVEVADPDDVYLVALAVKHGAALVSGDAHLTGLSSRLPIFSPADFLARISQGLPE